MLKSNFYRFSKKLELDHFFDPVGHLERSVTIFENSKVKYCKIFMECSIILEMTPLKTSLVQVFVLAAMQAISICPRHQQADIFNQKLDSRKTKYY